MLAENLNQKSVVVSKYGLLFSLMKKAAKKSIAGHV
jgi:hypothetical protein